MTLSDFLDHLERAIHPFAGSELPDDWMAFRRQCEAREEAGREEFGDDWRYRDNSIAGREEGADGANYAHFESERTLEQGGDYDDVLQLALIAAKAFFEAHQALAQMRASTPPVLEKPPGHGPSTYAERERAAREHAAST